MSIPAAVKTAHHTSNDIKKSIGFSTLLLRPNHPINNIAPTLACVTNNIIPQIRNL